MYAVMAAQLALFDLFWGTKQFLLLDVLWHVARRRDVWRLVRLVFASKQMKPICDAYYTQEGGDLIDALHYSLLHSSITSEGVIISEYTQRPYTRDELHTNITQRTLHRPNF